MSPTKFDDPVLRLSRCLRNFSLLFAWFLWSTIFHNRVLCVICFYRSDEEFREWKQKLSDMEGVCSELRVARSRLEGRISELEQLLAAEVSNSQSLSDALERETESRVATQKQLHTLQQRHPGEQFFIFTRFEVLCTVCHVKGLRISAKRKLHAEVSSFTLRYMIKE